MVHLEGVQPGPSGISAPSSRAVHLDPAFARGPRDAFLVGTEFGHLHGDGSGSLHVALPEPRGAEAIAKGWGETHPAARMGIAPPTLVMLYGPRTDGELAIVWQLVEESYAYARERLDTEHPGDAHGDRAAGSAPPPDPTAKETNMADTSAPASVLEAVTSWPGVSTKTNPRGATAIVFDGHELGHVHSDRGTLDLPLSVERRAHVLEAQRANDWFSNWVSKPLEGDGGADDAIALLRESYDELRTR